MSEGGYYSPSTINVDPRSGCPFDIEYLSHQSPDSAGPSNPS